MRTWLAAWISIATLAHGADAPREFATAMPVIAEPGAAFYQVELPSALYRGVAHADLRDVRVFNAGDEVVPHALRPRVAATTATPATIALPFFPLRGDPAREVGELRVRVQKRADGTLVDIRSDDKGAKAASVMRGYLLDASRTTEPIRALIFDWKTPREGYSGKVRIEASEDLTRWVPIVNEAALLDLEFGGHRLEAKRVQMRGQKHKYLRMSWPQGQKAVELTAVRGESVPAASEPHRTWIALGAGTAGKQPGEYAYDVGGYIPFDRLRVELPQANTVALVQILGRDKASDEWRPLASALVYRLQREGSEVSSPEIAVTGGGQRALLLRIDQKGGGVGSGTPTVHLGWVPQQLVFAARGAGPFRLVYGSQPAREAAFPIRSLLPGYGSEQEFAAQPAKLGEPAVLAGEKTLRAPVDYKRWVLWGSLILGAALLGLMAYRLLRQIGRTSPSNTQSDRAAR